MGGWVGEISQAQISQRLHLTSATMNIPQTQACAACRFARVTLEETTDLATKRVWMFPEEDSANRAFGERFRKLELAHGF